MRHSIATWIASRQKALGLPVKGFISNPGPDVPIEDWYKQIIRALWDIFMVASKTGGEDGELEKTRIMFDSYELWKGYTCQYRMLTME